jgi:hypothetical protein
MTDEAITWLLGDPSQGNAGAHIVFSPHIYPKEVANWESVPGYPSTMRFDWNFGFLYDAGYPIVLGETSWKTDEGKQFFENALMPYMSKKGIDQSNIFAWGIGYLGDTQSFIDPNTGLINCDMSLTLSKYFGSVKD